MTADLHGTVGTAQWVEELGTQVLWMAHHGIGSASLHLTPPDLGPIEARITVQAGTASVWFGAPHPDTRAALEQALPRLREMFAMQGMSLGDSGVFRESPQRRQPLAVSAISGGSPVQAPVLPSAAPTPTAAADRLIDLYA